MGSARTRGNNNNNNNNKGGSSGRSSGTVLDRPSSTRAIPHSYNDPTMTEMSAVDSAHTNPTMAQSKSVMGAVGSSVSEYFSDLVKGVREGGLFRQVNNSGDSSSSDDSSGDSGSSGGGGDSHMHNNKMEDASVLDGPFGSIDVDNRRRGGGAPSRGGGPSSPSSSTPRGGVGVGASIQNPSASLLLPPMSTSALLSYARPLGA